MTLTISDFLTAAAFIGTALLAIGFIAGEVAATIHHHHEDDQ